MIKNFINTVKRFRLFTLLNLLGLTVAFFAFMVVVMQTRVELSRDTSYVDAERIYVLQHPSSWEKGAWTSMLYRPIYDAIPSLVPQTEQYAVRSFSSSVFGGERYKFESPTGDKPAFNNSTSTISRSFVDMFDMQIVDGAIGSDAEPWMMIPESIAKQYFPNGSAVGQILKVVGQAQGTPVSAVYRNFPSTSSFPNEIYTNVGNDDLSNWGDSNYNIYLKLPLGSALTNAKNSIDKFASDNNLGFKIRLLPLEELYFSTDTASDDSDFAPSSSRDSMTIFAFLALLIVVIAGINYLNFTTAMIPVRIKDINTRKIYGATNASIRMQLISESVLMCFSAFLIASALMTSFDTLDSISFISTRIVVAEQILPIALITGLLSIALGLLAGLYPAFYATSAPTAYIMKGSFSLSGKGRSLRTVLLSVQYVFSIGLITMAIIMNLQYGVLSRSNLGFDRENILTMPLSENLSAAQDGFIGTLRSRPDVRDVTFVNSTPFFSDDNTLWRRDFRDTTISFEVINVHSSFPRLFGLEIVDGRTFNQSDDLKDQHSMILFNQSAQKLYGMKIGEMVGNSQVVGIMRDFNYKPLNSNIGPMALSIIGNYNASSTLYIRCQSSDYRALIDFIRTQGRTIDPDWDSDIAFMDSRINELYQREAQTIGQVNISSALAIVISLLGVFGLIHFDIQRRRKEIALRKINGASTINVLSIFNRKFITMICICFVIATPMVWWVATRWLSDFAYRTPIYWWIPALALLIVMVITILTVTLQSWRAASENPIRSLKTE